ncbi:MAG: hypothetical protein KFF77_00690 [Bacteroidetes bacterium]|nr:hypothetical protein [Bacteroidota bacterium]
MTQALRPSVFVRPFQTFRSASCIIALGMMLCFAPALRAQDKPLPPPRDFKPETKELRDVLPALSLPEYVITGSDMIRFVEDRKGAASEPDSRMFTARAGRGEREPRFTDTSPTRMPLRKPDLTGSDEVLRLRAGIGMYSTPLFEIWYGDRYTDGDAAAHAAYERSAGHVDRADYSAFHFDMRGGTYLPRDVHPLFASSRLQADAAVDVRDYGLFADRLTRSDQQMDLDFRRRTLGLRLGADLLSRRNVLADHTLRLSFAHRSIDETLGLRDSLELDEYRQIENRLGLDATTRLSMGSHDVDFSLLLHVNDLSERGPGSTRPFYIKGSGGTVFPLGDATRLEAGLALNLYRGSDHASQFRLYPTLLLRRMLNSNWSLFGGWLPEVREHTLEEFLHVNPYMMLASVIRHSDIPWRFTLGTEFDNRRKSSARFAIEYLSTSSWPRFSLLPDPVRQQWELRYDGRASVFSARTELSHRFGPDTRLQASLDLRTSALGEAQGRIPYLPDYEARLLLSHAFPFGLCLQSTMQLVGEQEADGGALPAWLLLGLELDYRLLPNLGLFLRFDNLLDQNRQQWPGYRERPFFLMGGVTAHF